MLYQTINCLYSNKNTYCMEIASKQICTSVSIRLYSYDAPKISSKKQGLMGAKYIKNRGQKR